MSSIHLNVNIRKSQFMK